MFGLQIITARQFNGLPLNRSNIHCEVHGRRDVGKCDLKLSVKNLPQAEGISKRGGWNSRREHFIVGLLNFAIIFANINTPAAAVRFAVLLPLMDAVWRRL